MAFVVVDRIRSLSICSHSHISVSELAYSIHLYTHKFTWFHYITIHISLSFCSEKNETDVNVSYYSFFSVCYSLRLLNYKRQEQKTHILVVASCISYRYYLCLLYTYFIFFYLIQYWIFQFHKRPFNLHFCVLSWACCPLLSVHLLARWHQPIQALCARLCATQAQSPHTRELIILIIITIIWPSDVHGRHPMLTKCTLCTLHM